MTKSNRDNLENKDSKNTVNQGEQVNKIKETDNNNKKEINDDKMVDKEEVDKKTELAKLTDDENSTSKSKAKRKRKKPDLPPIECAVCGVEFKPADNRRRACSRSCGGKLGNTPEARAKGRQTRLEKYGDENFNNREKYKETVKDKYGEEYINPSQVPEIKAKIVKTYTERHGGMGMASESTAKKVFQAIKENYGVGDDDSIVNVGQIKEIKDKIRETHEERWGGIGFASEELGQRSKDTFKELYGEDIYDSKYRSSRITQSFMEKYGVNSPAKVPEFKEKLIQNYIKNNGGMGNARDSVKKKLEKDLIKFKELYDSDKYTLVEIEEMMGVSKSTIGDWAKRLGIEISQPNRLNETWQLLIRNETGLEFEYEGYIYGESLKRVDLYNEDLKIGIEINPTVTHSSQKTPFPHRNTTPTKYHQEKAILAEENGWHLIQVFDWDKPEDIIKLLKSLANIEQEIIYARKCEIKSVNKEDANEFINANHRQGSGAKFRIAYGLYYENELVQIMTFSKERFVKSEIENSYELLRLCSKEGVRITGGANRLMKAFINSEHEPARIKTFVDYSKGQGKIYEQMGMEYVGLANLNAYYANIDTGEAHKVTAVTNMYRDEYQELGKSQKEFMNERRFYRINDAGNKIFEWNKK